MECEGSLDKYVQVLSHGAYMKSYHINGAHAQLTRLLTTPSTPPPNDFG